MKCLAANYEVRHGLKGVSDTFITLKQLCLGMI